MVLKRTALQCGSKELKEQFGLEWRNLNHGSFGTYPIPVRDALRQFQDQSEARPDYFIRYNYPKQLDTSRSLIASHLHVEASTCVFVPNATTGINTVLRNLTWAPGDVIIYFSTIYGACEKSISYITETTPAESAKISYTYPVSDAFLCDTLVRTIESLKQAGKTPRLALFDTIVSLPGVRMPFERLTSLCRAHDVLSCIDGAHAVGHIPLDLDALDPDFFVSNAHKWLLVPRGNAVFYVPERNQHLIRSTLPTSHGFVPQPLAVDGGAPVPNPLPPSQGGKSDYVRNFEFVGTVDSSPYLCVPAALEFRAAVEWKGRSGEEAIMGYCHEQARAAGKLVAGVLGTNVLENDEGTLGNCNFSNVRLPLDFATVCGGDGAVAVKVAQWIAKTLVEDYDTFVATIFYGNAWWVRLSSQIYLTMEDWEWAGETLKHVCARVEAGEWK